MLYTNSLEHVYIYIEKQIVKKFSFDLIIDELKNLKERMTILCICVISCVGTVILNYLFTFIFIFIILLTIIKYINFEF